MVESVNRDMRLCDEAWGSRWWLASVTPDSRSPVVGKLNTPLSVSKFSVLHEPRQSRKVNINLARDNEFGIDEIIIVKMNSITR